MSSASFLVRPLLALGNERAERAPGVLRSVGSGHDTLVASADDMLPMLPSSAPSRSLPVATTSGRNTGVWQERHVCNASTSGNLRAYTVASHRISLQKPARPCEQVATQRASLRRGTDLQQRGGRVELEQAPGVQD